MSPLTLSASLNDGREMFDFMLGLETKQDWRYGCVSSWLCPLEELDLDLKTVHAMRNGKRRRRAGAVEIACRMANTDILLHPRLQDLIEKKWNKFGKVRQLLTRAIGEKLFIFLVYSVNSLLKCCTRWPSSSYFLFLSLSTTHPPSTQPVRSTHRLLAPRSRKPKSKYFA